MLWIIVVILFALWLIGLLSSIGWLLVHILLVISLILVIVNLT